MRAWRRSLIWTTWSQYCGNINGDENDEVDDKEEEEEEKEEEEDDDNEDEEYETSSNGRNEDNDGTNEQENMDRLINKWMDKFLWCKIDWFLKKKSTTKKKKTRVTKNICLNIKNLFFFSIFIFIFHFL